MDAWQLLQNNQYQATNQMADPIEQFNQHQIDTRNRFNFLVQSVLLLGGGALTASIAVFTGSRNIQLPEPLAWTLSYAWWSLVTSMCLAIIVVTVVVVRDYYFAEQWRKKLKDSSFDFDDSPGRTDIAIIILGFISLLSFLAGFIGLAHVATQVIVP